MPTYWQPPVIWPGATVFILGGGPSLLEADLTLLHEHRCIGCNDAYKLGHWVDVCYFGDASWLDAHREDDGLTHREALMKWPNLMVTCSKVNPGLARAHWLERLDGGVQEAPRVGWYMSTGASAVNLAVILGATKVVLVGFDMKMREMEPKESAKVRDLRKRYKTLPSKERSEFANLTSNWHMNLKDQNFPNLLLRFIAGFEQLKKDLRAKRPDVQVVNATPGSAMGTFPIVELRDVV